MKLSLYTDDMTGKSERINLKITIKSRIQQQGSEIDAQKSIELGNIMKDKILQKRQ